MLLTRLCGTSSVSATSVATSVSECYIGTDFFSQLQYLSQLGLREAFAGACGAAGDLATARQWFLHQPRFPPSRPVSRGPCAPRLGPSRCDDLVDDIVAVPRLRLPPSRDRLRSLAARWPPPHSRPARIAGPLMRWARACGGPAHAMGMGTRWRWVPLSYRTMEIEELRTRRARDA